MGIENVLGQYQDRQSPSALHGVSLAIGLLTLSQVAAQLPLDREGDPAFLVNRLIVRGSLPTVRFGDRGEVRVDLEALQGFLKSGGMTDIRRAYNLPPETCNPVFPIVGNDFSNPWNGDVQRTIGGLISQMTLQVPKGAPATLSQVNIISKGGVDKLATGRIAKGPFVTVRDGQFNAGDSPLLLVIYPDSATELAQGFPLQNGETTIQAEMTTALRSLIAAPPPVSSAMFPKADASMFLNMGEMYLTLRLQLLAIQETANRMNASDAAEVTKDGVRRLYQSPEEYNSIVAAAIAKLESGKYSGIYNTIPFQWTGPTGTSGIAGITLTISDAAVLAASGSSTMRLASLAF